MPSYFAAPGGGRAAINTNNLSSTAGATTITTPTTEKMGGIGWAFTPTSSGQVFVSFRGSASSTTAATALTLRIRRGTGSAPATNDAVTGTQIGDDIVIPTVAGVTFFDNFCSTFLASLTPNTGYWFDISAICAAGNASIPRLDVTVFEL